MRKWIGNEPPNKVTPLTSNKNGVESVIVDMMGYDEFGHMVYQKLGNGTETTYAYDRQRQRLQEMNLSTAGSQLMQNRYEYDKVDNILSLVNSVNPQTLTEQNTAKLGGTSTHRYQYDELNRLISAQGKAKNASYSLNMAFNVMSMPTSKVQTVDSTETAQSYHNTYLYDDKEHPTAPTQIGNERYQYDANGNPILVTNDSLNTTRELYWDEENRLMVLSDNGKTSRYTYNHAGDRIVKSHGDLEGVYINGAPQGITFHEHDEFTLYPASIISVNKNRFTKHYFIGDKRIASKLGSGQFNNVYGRNGSYITAGQQDYAERLNQIESQREEYYKELGIPPGVPTMKGAFGEPENTGVGYNTIITELGDHSVPKNWAQFVVKREPGETPGPPIIWSDPQNPEEVQPGYGFIADDDENVEEIFFYHSDHLGSTSYITDGNGNITQYTAYLPYGELLVDEHSSSEDLPYKFNGKELDEETGLYYYGARYMQPVASVWYGVDPLTEKYASVSGYTYCLGNPIKLVDTDGEKPKPSEAARMAAHIYGDKKDNILTGGWRVSNKEIKGVKYNTANGLKSALYERVNKKGKVVEYAYVTCGSETTRDWFENVAQLKGASLEYAESAYNAMKISNAIGKDIELTFIGHSQGGGEAALNSLMTSNKNVKGRSAITFNAAGLSANTKFNIGGLKTLLKSGSKIDAYIMLTCPLNLYQNSIGTSLPHVDGNMHFLLPKDWSSIYNGHSMDNILKCYGISNPQQYNKEANK